MVRRRRRQTAGLLVALVAIALVATAAPAMAPATGAATLERTASAAATTLPSRIDRSDVTSAAVEVSRLAWGADAASWVVLSRDDTWPDSLAGAALTKRGPLLFTGSAKLTASTRAELDRVLPVGGRVYLLGGTKAISEEVRAALLAAGYDVRRLAGASRVETALAVADEVRRVLPGSLDVAIARAEGTATNPTAGWADSVTGGAAAAAHGLPIVITPSDRLHPEVDAWLDRVRPVTTFVLGGTAALSEQVAAATPNPRRVKGSSRAETASEIARVLWQVDPSSPRDGRNYLVINGWHESGWGFGLASATLAASVGAPLLLSDTASVPGVTLELAGSCGDGGTPTVTIVGSTTIVPAAREDQIRSYRPIACDPVSTSFRFMQIQDDGVTPVRYPPCAPVRLVANYTDAPSGAKAAVLDAVEQLRAATSLDLVYEGETTERLQTEQWQERPAQQDRYGPGYAPILVNWPIDYQSSSWGYAGSLAIKVGDDPWEFVTGAANFNSGAPATGDQLTMLVLHELAHVIGLDHVDDDTQVMYPTVNKGLTRYADGDLEGLRRVGRQVTDC